LQEAILNNRMNNKSLARFYQDLAIFINSGLTIERGLATLKQDKQGRVLWMMDGLQFHIGQGGTLWEGMAHFPKFFDEFQVMTIKAAEESGKLVETCRGLTRYYEVRHKEKRRLLASLVYPVVLLHGVVLLPPLKYLVIPKLGQSYWSVVLPPLLTSYGIIGLGYLSWKKFCKSGRIREILDEIIIRLPVIGKLARGSALARVMRALANLNNAGIEPVRAARQAIQTAGNTSIAWRLTGALTILERGGTFTDFFSFAGVLPPLQLGMVAVGEETGTLPDSLERMVIRMEEDNRRHLTTTIKTIGILAYVIAAAVVALTVLKFYAGYFSF
jgi:type II secretory pathway component PulF